MPFKMTKVGPMLEKLRGRIPIRILAREAGLHPSYITKIEHGIWEGQNQTGLETYRKIGEALIKFGTPIVDVWAWWLDCGVIAPEAQQILLEQRQSEDLLGKVEPTLRAGVVDMVKAGRQRDLLHRLNIELLAIRRQKKVSA